MLFSTALSSPWLPKGFSVSSSDCILRDSLNEGRRWETRSGEENHQKRDDTGAKVSKTVVQRAGETHGVTVKGWI